MNLDQLITALTALRDEGPSLAAARVRLELTLPRSMPDDEDTVDDDLGGVIVEATVDGRTVTLHGARS